MCPEAGVCTKLGVWKSEVEGAGQPSFRKTPFLGRSFNVALGTPCNVEMSLLRGQCPLLTTQSGLSCWEGWKRTGGGHLAVFLVTPKLRVRPAGS